MSDINLTDIPDLSGIEDSRPEFQPFEDGWYKGTILGKREFTDQLGNERVFESSDTPAQSGLSRNIRLQTQLTRQSDGKTLNISMLVNYQPEDLTAETVQKVLAQKEKVNTGEEEWGTLFRPYMTLNRISKLQKIAGVRGFSRTAEGGLDLTPVYGKEAYFRIRPDNRNDKYKEIADFSTEAPKKGLK